MKEIIRNRTIRPSTRQDSSKNYKIDTSKVNKDDILTANITHESKNFERKYRFKGSDLVTKNSIHFKVYENGNNIEIRWSGAQPIQ